MSVFKLTHNADVLAATLDDLTRRQLPFATALALTKTARAAQRRMQNRMPQVFNLRRTEALFRNAVKSKPATKRDLVADVRIEGPQSGAISADARVRRMILRHEEGGVHISAARYRTVRLENAALGFYLPARGLRTGNGGIPARLYPANIGAALRRDADASKLYYASNQKGRKVKRGGAQREFSYFATQLGIFERRVFGSGTAVRLLWAFEKQIRLRPRLGFYQTVDDTMREVGAANMEAALAYAIRTAK